MKKVLVSIAVGLASFFACSSAPAPDGGCAAACAAAGGSVVTGADPCQGGFRGTQCDSVPPNPGGFYCCIGCPPFEKPNADRTGCALSP
ncbi:MAG: hypothetical protein ACYDCL_00250 [Myxococcales bacterium]